MRKIDNESDPLCEAEPAENIITYRNYFDSPAGKELAAGKHHHTDRFEIAHPHKETWSNAKCGYVGYLTGRGYMSKEIERILNDGTIAASIRGQWRRWGLPIAEMGGRRCSVMPIGISMQLRAKLSKRARAAGLSPDEWLRRVILCAVDDDLYRAIVDDRFDPKPKREKVAKSEPKTVQ